MFEAAPRPVQSGTRTRTAAKAKYRDPADTIPLPRSNIHFDKRVVRGNTYAAQVNDATALLPPTKTQKLSSTFGRPAPRPVDSAARRRLLGQQAAAPVAGRAHMLVQTDEFLEDLADQIFEADTATQTDGVEAAEAPPIFMPKPVGEDAATSIEEGELFDFELAVQPTLEVVVGKALDQAMMEVLEEEELERLQEQRERFQQERNQILAETQRLEAQSQRHHAEKERRLQQERERLGREKELARKNAARTAARNFMQGLQEQVVSQLVQQGHLYDPVLKQVDTEFMPWLLQSVADKLALVRVAREETDALIGAAVQAAMQEVQDKREAEEAARVEAERQKAAAEAERQRLLEEERRLELEAEAARKEQEALEAAEALRKEREEDEDAEDADSGEDDEEDDEDEDDDL